MKFRDVGNVVLDRGSRALLGLRLGLQNALALTHRYQPDPFSPIEGQRDPRACEARFVAMSRATADLARPSVMDIGCNQGFFTFRFAQRGGVCFGIDNDRSELMTARARAALAGVRNVAFMELTLDEKSVMGLPRTDIVVCLSIYHHWVRYFGRDSADAVLAAIAGRATEALVFDTGQPEETETRWARELEFMKPTGREWIADRLSEFGFASVSHLGRFPTSLSPVPRDLFVARR
ncbi:class I SAM-dependent methyltransferase [Pseudorhodoplanes sp.]|uniref:class I SAM-dependent methyltransferase n=1 Tax=Pseudorhodoplanes sp. TaxID=1934341 RepID=UPI002B877043|nr:class I SAM-dependent methyltransferase [Pseudorhodoplanes sp.]HWV54430.1 class I SAM-dependent methyltransferase [Pseudorhodoplanes sp.]